MTTDPSAYAWAAYISHELQTYLSDKVLGDLELRGNDEAPWRCAVRIGDRDPELLLPGSLLLGLLGWGSTTSTPESSAALVSG